ncbi:heavy metal translocating P-type ATPase metal-binding domain-containing protein [Luteolibacter flavescens]|uniref:Heavy metal translocating P-type ATPase metal-binding domain-containing protein n=1 Tax=Luteolibacter flavescens TaxID=1859460 RepID=A0ABT3FQY1_9BACT|nr:heavy metal translocating P-type ATPase metal-binding domain-containing protein [Luteolibacter flavescens]MCW1885704.1 heavy metal translocating P-type ATPase metal-binding domain-containing protein [Luteolibacter flavescens]
MKASASASTCVCDHCGTAFTPTVRGSEDRARDRYCCRGCEYVATLIRDQGFDRYYDLKQDVATAPVRSRPFEDHDFAWLRPLVDAAEAREGNDAAQLDCAIEGISCIGCVWLIDRLFERHDGAIRAAANPANGRLHLEWQRGSCDVGAYLKELASFGYVAAPAAAGSRDTSPERRGLAGRMGLCGAFALNAMGFSLPTYLGMPADFEFAGLFRLIAFTSATLAMLVGGGFFISRAWRALRIGTLHIDLPIALGLIAAYLGSIAGWAAGEERLLYFDFVATFVFLMLLGRYVQTAAVEKNRLRLVRRSPLPESVRSGDALLPISSLQPGTRFQLEPGKALPVSACLSDGTAEVSLEWIHGEADPVILHPGSRLPAGAILLGRRPVTVTADETWADSLISKLVADAFGDRGSPVFQRLLKIYLGVVLVTGVAVFAFWAMGGDARTGLQAMISVFVVSCPCALGVAVPLADEWAAARLARAGAFVRRASLWPRLRRVKHVVFDKTGTLTLERPLLENPAAVDALGDHAALALARLTRGSLHPVSRTLLEALGNRGQRLLEALGPVEVTEIPGQGVRATMETGEWFLGKSSQRQGTELRHDGSLIAAFTFSDALRPGAADALRHLERRGLSIHILSGDSPLKVASLARSLGLPYDQSHGGLSPEEKCRAVQALDRQDTLYVGDGANDSLAFDAAFVTGTPVVDRSLLESKSDFYALGSCLAWLPEAFAAADARAHGVRRAFIFALSYNLVVVALSATAHMSPLLAAVLMPLSSVVSILLVAFRTRMIELHRTHDYGRDVIRKEEGSPSRLRFSSRTRHEPKSGDQAVRSHLA